MLEKLLCHELWQAYLEYKVSRQLLTSCEERYLRDFVEKRKYLPIAQRVVAGEFRFSVPEKKELNKVGSSKKRVVYRFPDEENMLLKMLSWLLYRYDDAIPDNCYSFRKGTGARKAFRRMADAPGVGRLHGFKADISNYFNSIDVPLMLGVLREVITDDAPLLALLTDLLQDDRALWQGEIIHEPRGVMAGTPTSPFFANLYLREMDAYFAARNVLYARYSDDILIFGTQEELAESIAAYRGFLSRYCLVSNPAKEERFAPGEKWHFLGFEYDRGTVDISEVAVRKLKDKVRRAAKSIRRWMLRKGASPQGALKAFNRKFNRKFYNAQAGSELCWCRWYFPIITTARSLHIIDQHMQDWQRYIVTGKHNKANYRRVPYAMLTQCEYRPLVTAYYAQDRTEPQRTD